MNENTKMQVVVLIDMLMDYTSRMMRMMADGIFDGEDFTQCRNTILAFQSEIKKRQMNVSTEESTSRMRWADMTNYKDGTIN